VRRTFWIGTSGWQYESWKGRFYPRTLPKSGWLAFYAERFATVEVNNSFYRLPSDAAFERWRDGTPPGFLIAPKVSRYLTHIRRLRDARESMELFWSRARRLGSKLGPLLFQLPPTFAADEERLAAFLELLPKGARGAFEFRHPSWETETTRSLLDAAGAALVLADRPEGGVTFVSIREPGAERATHARNSGVGRTGSRSSPRRTSTSTSTTTREERPCATPAPCSSSSKRGERRSLRRRSPAWKPRAASSTRESRSHRPHRSRRRIRSSSPSRSRQPRCPSSP
jgi:uncharacterized protein YecE (DUF72 family)